MDRVLPRSCPRRAGTRRVHVNEVLTQEQVSRIDAECTHAVTPQKFYYLGREIGLDWQRPFYNITGRRGNQESCIATVSALVSETDPGGMGDLLHPALLDTCLFHGLCSIIIVDRGGKSTCVPTFIKHLRISNRGNDLVCTTTGGDDAMIFDVVVREGGNRSQHTSRSLAGRHPA